MAQTPLRLCLVGSKYSQSRRLAASFSSGSCLFRLSCGHSVSSLLLGGALRLLGPAIVVEWERRKKEAEAGCVTR